MEKRMVFHGDFEADLVREYKAMLSIGLSEQEAERRLIAYYLDDAGMQSLETMFWVTLARIQWSLGRLSPSVKAEALAGLEALLEAGANDTLLQVYETLQSPQPLPKKLRKPALRRCPWEVGSLLAYRIVSSPKLEGHPCFGKYALLRVVKIDRRPVSNLAPCELWEEFMRVAVYGWIGDRIPEPGIAEGLELIPVHGDNLWVFFNWVPTKHEKQDITLLDCDRSFAEHMPGGMDFDAVPYVLTHYLPFDVALAQSLSPYL